MHHVFLTQGLALQIKEGRREYTPNTQEVAGKPRPLPTRVLHYVRYCRRTCFTMSGGRATRVRYRPRTLRPVLSTYAATKGPALT